MILDENTLKELKEKELDILIYFDQVCRQNNISYSLSYGTLLGAIRHQGFIPWDDDIDVIMLREEYNKLFSILKENKNEKYFFQCHETDPNYYYGFAKIRLNNSYFGEKMMKNRDIHQGIYIDIFIADNLPKNDNRIQKAINKVRNWKLIVNSKFINNKYRQGKKKIIFKTLKLLTFPISIKYAYQKMLKHCQKFNIEDSLKCRNYICHKIDEVLIKADFYEMIDIDFEGFKFKAFKNYDRILKEMYGDYMTLPPVEERVCKHEVDGIKFNLD